MKYYTTMKKECTNRFPQLGWISRALCSGGGGAQKPISKGHVVSDSIYVAFLKWQSSRDGQLNSSCPGLGMVGGGQVGVAIKGHHQRSLWCQNSLVS